MVVLSSGFGHQLFQVFQTVLDMQLVPLLLQCAFLAASVLLLPLVNWYRRFGPRVSTRRYFSILSIVDV
jgi:hypothetical protein